MNAPSASATDLHQRQDASSNGMRPLFITVLAAKVAVCAFLLTTATLAPPVSADQSYFAKSQ